MPELDLEVARWLVGADGLAAVGQATQLLDAGEQELRLVTTMRARTGDRERTAAVVAAAIARRRARRRWPDADRLLFTREALEQASDPVVAAWRARRLTGLPVHDLCCGVGGDAMAIARRAASVTAVDVDPARLVLLAHNASVSGLPITPVCADALDLEVGAEQVVHVDPARRRGGRRIADPLRTVPPVDRLLTVHARAPGMAVVLAPGTDAQHPALGADVEVEYLQLGDDLVEAVAWSGTLRSGSAEASATLLPREPAPSRPTGADGGLTADAIRADTTPPGPDGWDPPHRARAGGRGRVLPVGPIGDHLVEVAVAAIRARLHDAIGEEIGAHRLARTRALLTADGPVPASAWYRARPVLEVLPARPAAIRRWLAGAERGPMELVLHGVSVDPEIWWRELGRPPRGPGGVRIELVRRDEDRVAVVTRDLPRS